MSKTLVVLLALVVSVSSLPAGNQSDDGQFVQNRIVGGNIVQPYDLPYIVSLQMQNEFNAPIHRCGGSIINQRWILTAAHCVYRVKTQALYVRAGTKQIFGGYVYNVYQTIVHPQYSETTRVGDIAVAKTSQTIFYSTYIQPISISESFIQSQSYAEVAGWGQTKNNNQNGENSYLYKISTRTILNNDCKSKYISNAFLYNKVFETNVCTLTYGNGICTGDTGSPLTISGQLVGVASWYYGCANGFPDVYTRTDKYRTWILTTSRV